MNVEDSMAKVIIEGILFDATANEVIINERHQRLEPRVMQLLLLLARNTNKTVTNEDILKTVWPDTIVTSDSISQCISQLRRIFNDDPKQPRVLKTIPKLGYRLIAPVRFVEHEEKVPSELQPKSTTHKPTKIAIIFAALAFIVSSLILYGSGVPWGIGVGIVIAASTLIYILAYLVSIKFENSLQSFVPYKIFSTCN